ncbi:MAG: sulfotransferase, partial [Cyclobacteriaceae bacterium]|nr:sulfotransferase [Cyclobacteriaceae bacterium]
KNFMRLFIPDERPGDGMKISVDLPQEDEYALSNITYRSFYHFFYFPSLYRSFYRRYIRFDSLSENEEEDWELNYHNMVIKALMNTNGIRAVLKNPVNTGRMIKLLEIFPGAHFIFMIRNPIIVYLSTKKFFTQLFPTLNLEKFSNDEISRMILELYSRLLQDYLSDKKQIDPNRIVEIRFEMLHQNPIEEIEKIYNKFGFSDFKDIKPLFLEYLDTQKEHKKNSYSIEQQELDRVMTKLEFAMKHWNYDIPQELQVLHKNYKSGEKVITI